MISVQIIKDSINSKTDDRLTTFILTFPRFILAEFNTHRILSRNSASSRAIPSKKIIEMITTEPAMPEFWGKNQSGMQAYEELDDIIKKDFLICYDEYQDKYLTSNKTEKELAKYYWLEARDQAIKSSEKLIKLGIHKQIANRILEPWFNMTVLVSGTEWENFFALRAHKDAQPEFRVLAEMMLEEYNKNIPKIRVPRDLDPAEWSYNLDLTKANLDWHIPFGDKMPEGLSKLDKIKVAIARAARLSYLTFDGEMNIEKDFDIYNRLLNSNPKHASPGEHIAFPIIESKFVGNFKGWYSFRKLLPNENAKDSRVIKRKVVDGKVI